MQGCSLTVPQVLPESWPWDAGALHLSLLPAPPCKTQELGSHFCWTCCCFHCTTQCEAARCRTTAVNALLENAKTVCSAQIVLQWHRKSLVPTDWLDEAAAEIRSCSSAHILCIFFHCSIWKHLSAGPYTSNFSFSMWLGYWFLSSSSNRAGCPKRAQPPPETSLPATVWFWHSCSAGRTFTFVAWLQLQSCLWLWGSKCLDDNAEFWDHGWYRPISAAP